MRYYYLIIFSMFSLLIFKAATGQLIIEAGDLDMHIKYDSVILQYQIPESALKRETHEVKLFFRDSDYNYYSPNYLDGDVGNVPHSNNMKSIRWQALQDDIDLNQKLFPTLVVDYEKMGGPKNAWVSALIPGAGDGLVYNGKNMTFKPWMRTISSYGFIAAGIYATTQRTRTEIYSVNKPDEFIGYSDWNHWLFKGDRTLFLAAGIGIWLYDIFWVYSQGMKNERLNKILNRWSANISGQTSQIGYKFKINR